MEKRNDKIDRLITGYLEGKLTNREYKELMNFLMESPANLAYFDKYRFAWEPEENTESSRAWGELQTAILRRQDLETSLSRGLRFPRQLLKYAAVIFLGLMLGAVLVGGYFVKQSMEQIPIALSAPAGEKSFLLLPDSTKVWLNGGSTISTMPGFGIMNRKVSLTGEAYFEVTHDHHRPFVVSTDRVRVKVLGTKFNISSYPGQDLVETTLREGSIELSSVEAGQFGSFVMKANEVAVYNRQTRTITRQIGDVETRIAWKDHELIIENEHYLRVFRKLENWYGVSIHLENSPAYEPNYSMTIKTESLREILDLISLITPIDYQIEGEEVILEFKQP